MIVIVPQMVTIIKEAALQSSYKRRISLIIPPDTQMARVPEVLADKEERIRCLIKQFLLLRDIKASLQVLTIINTGQATEDSMLITYLKYEYLYENPIVYHTASIEKDRFHKAL